METPSEIAELPLREYGSWVTGIWKGCGKPAEEDRTRGALIIWPFVYDVLKSNKSSGRFELATNPFSEGNLQL